MKQLILTVGALLFSSLSFAYVEVIDPDARVARLERQVHYLKEMNLVEQLQSMQQQLQAMQGQLEVSHYEIEKLKNQQKSFYEDLDKRIQAVNATHVAKSAAVPKPLPVSLPDAPKSDADSYQAAFSLVKAKQFDQAIAAFEHYVRTNEKGAFLANAHYWLGELYFIQNDLDKAKKAFSAVIKRFPESSKRPGAELKLAKMDLDHNQKEQAKVRLAELVKKFPQTSAAKLAKQMLAEIG